jgi:hypothetical protein
LAAMTSSAWVPMEPVLPSTRVLRRRLVTHSLCRVANAPDEYRRLRR